MARHRPLSSLLLVSRKGTADAIRKLRNLAREVRLLKVRIQTAQDDKGESFRFK